jgi:hypothetical protein
VFSLYDDKSGDCSTEYVNVFTSTLEQQTYKEEKKESEQSPKCFSRPCENPSTEVVSEFAPPYKVDVFEGRYIKFRHGQCIQQVLESGLISGYALGDVQLLKDYKWNMLVTEKGRELWRSYKIPYVHDCCWCYRIAVCRCLQVCNGTDTRCADWCKDTHF